MLRHTRLATVESLFSHRNVGRTLDGLGPEGAPLDLLGRLLDGAPHGRLFFTPPKVLHSSVQEYMASKMKYSLAEGGCLTLETSAKCTTAQGTDYETLVG